MNFFKALVKFWYRIIDFTSYRAFWKVLLILNWVIKI